MADNEDVNTLKRRGRRRLVGAIALVLAAVIVLPMVFDSEQKGSVPPVSVRIPSEDESGFTPKVTPKVPPPQEARAPEKAPEKVAEKPPEKAAEKPVEKAVGKPAEKQVAEKAPEKPVEKPVAKAPDPAPKPAVPAEAERKRAETALAGGEQFIVPAGAYADPTGVVEKLKEARIPFYTEPIAVKQGTVTRVRAGPFASREAAEKVLQQLKGLGLKPGNVTAKS
jgi:DedD protein